MFFESMHPGWQALLSDQRATLNAIEQHLNSLGDASGEITPPLPQVMRALQGDPTAVRVLLVGQDPYPTKGHATGLAFEVSPQTRPLPRSLSNMMKELKADLPECSNGADLTRWQAQGVLLLNRHLTTAVGQAAAHSDLGWADFTSAVVRALAQVHHENW